MTTNIMTEILNARDKTMYPSIYNFAYHPVLHWKRFQWSDEENAVIRVLLQTERVMRKYGDDDGAEVVAWVLTRLSQFETGWLGGMYDYAPREALWSAVSRVVGVPERYTYRTFREDGEVVWMLTNYAPPGSDDATRHAWLRGHKLLDDFENKITITPLRLAVGLALRGKIEKAEAEMRRGLWSAIWQYYQPMYRLDLPSECGFDAAVKRKYDQWMEWLGLEPKPAY